MIPAALVFVALTATAQTPPKGFLLRVQDAEGVLDGEATVQMIDSSGLEFEVDIADNGSHPDALRDDGVLSAAAFGAASGDASITIEAGDRVWTGVVALELEGAHPEVSLMVAADGSVVAYDGDQPQVRASPLIIADPSGEAVAAATNMGMRGVWLWLVLFGAIGVGLAHAVVRFGRRPVGGSRLSPGPAPGEAPTERFDAPQLPVLLDALEGERRVVVLGPVPSPRAWLLHVEDHAPLPQELVLAVERLAARDGLPVALVITDPSRLDGPEPIPELARLVARRFPLWVQSGPADWRVWDGA